MPQQPLQPEQVAPVAQKLRGEGVSQSVGVQVGHARAGAQVGKELDQPVRGQRPPFPREEQRPRRPARAGLQPAALPA